MKGNKDFFRHLLMFVTGLLPLYVGSIFMYADVHTIKQTQQRVYEDRYTATMARGDWNLQYNINSNQTLFNERMMARLKKLEKENQ